MTPEEVLAVSNECAICGATDGQVCLHEDGRPVGVAKLHVARLRKQWGDAMPIATHNPWRRKLMR